MCPTGADDAAAACTLLTHVSAERWEAGQIWAGGGEGKQGPMGRTRNFTKGGWGGGKKLEHLFRGWWTIGVCGSGVTKGGV